VCVTSCSARFVSRCDLTRSQIWRRSPLPHRGSYPAGIAGCAELADAAHRADARSSANDSDAHRAADVCNAAHPRMVQQHHASCPGSRMPLYGPRDANKRVAKEAERAVCEIKPDELYLPLTPHEARHCAASYLIAAGLNAKELKRLHRPLTRADHLQALRPPDAGRRAWRVAVGAAHDGLDAMRAIYPRRHRQLTGYDLPRAGEARHAFEQAWLDHIGLAETVMACDFGDALSSFDTRDAD
jgi:hypothetical protein